VGTAEVTVRPAEPADAPAIVAALHRAEGLSHFDTWMYDPSLVAQALHAGTIRSWVAADGDGVVRAHAALILGDASRPLQRIGTGQPVLEFGLAFTDPAFRGQGLALLIGGRALAWAQQHHVGEVYSWTTTLRPFAQSALREAGAVEICLLLAMMPAGVNRGYRHDIAEAAAAMLFVLRLGPPRRCQTWHVPEAYRPITARLTAGLGITVSGLPDATPAPDVGPEAADQDSPWQYFAPLRFGVIDVAEVQPLTVARIVGRTLALAQAGANVTYVDLPPERPEVMHLMPALAHHGFTFAGVHPHYATGELRLRLQAVTCPLQPRDTITTASDLGRDLLATTWRGLPGRQ
jgi:GNAT superfamily N-acetyltransferase